VRTPDKYADERASNAQISAAAALWVPATTGALVWSLIDFGGLAKLFGSLSLSFIVMIAFAFVGMVLGTIPKEISYRRTRKMNEDRDAYFRWQKHIDDEQRRLDQESTSEQTIVKCVCGPGTLPGVHDDACLSFNK
jgi:hypothetical protein